MRIYIGSDHAGFDYKEKIKDLLTSKQIDCHDVGPFSTDRVDYPDFAHLVAAAVNKQEVDFGILLCGSGNGVAMTANKYKNVRAALAWQAELAALGKQHNNANILVIPARFVSEKEMLLIVESFLESTFEGGRHLTRVKKISC